LWQSILIVCERSDGGVSSNKGVPEYDEHRGSLEKNIFESGKIWKMK